jgi:2-dehydro-3-deoxyphosphogluconate aldolase/(4S)-4-hydroxy-2-oxoglutarate aldolase
MARFARLDVYRAMLDTGLVPLFYEADPGRALEACRALVAGGARVIEFTNRGESAYPVFVELAHRLPAEVPDAILGVGTVIDAPTAALFIAAGANFVVSPAFDEGAARLCNLHRIPYLPGCSTATEIGHAEELGAEIVKLFPGSLVGPAGLKALLGPSPWSRLMPTGGVEPTAESIGAWIKAGAACVGLGSNLLPADDMKAARWDAITERTAAAMGLIAKARTAR